MTDELLFVVDENDKPIAPLPRSQVIKQKLWRRTGSATIINAEKTQVLSERRADTIDERPGLWVVDFGGKSLAGEDPETTTLRELKEELGLDFKASDLHFNKKLKSDDRKQIEYLYWLTWDGVIDTINYDPKEVSAVKWRDITEVISILSVPTPGWYSYGFEVELLKAMRRGHD